MKKMISIGLIFLMIIGVLAGCTSTNSTEPSQEDVKQYTIGIGQFGEHGSLDNCREGFILGLEEEGFVVGENLTIIDGNAQFDIPTANQIFQNFASKNVDLMAAIATPMAQTAYSVAMDKGIPVVFTAVTDPVAAELTEGNITGTSDKLPVEAQLKLIRAMMPEAKNIGILFTTSEVNSVSVIEEYKTLAPTYGFNIVDMGINTTTDIPQVLDKLLPQVDALSNLTDNTVVASLPLLLERAGEREIPIFGSEIEQVRLGSIASEGIEYIELGKQTGRMAAQILRGEKTADEMEFETITESSLYINPEVMERFGLTLPQEMMDRAIVVESNEK
ncbi:ABC transporter substrate-binding protein [Tissierella creatinini]|nr:ABC transporter substrate-binding protein [Tissierella creatinini]TJX64666.1 ABC transporter substrate-binding protein [Soehngenia saccharolytica]